MFNGVGLNPQKPGFKEVEPMKRSLMQVASLILAGAIDQAAAPAAVTQESADNHPLMTVHVYNYAHIPVWRLARTQKRVEGIFLGAGIRLRWVDTALPSSDGSSPADPAWHPDPFDLVLKIVSGFPRNNARFYDLVFGITAGSQSIIFNDKTQAVASSAEVTHPEILAITIAHELGHALLGPDAHSDTGIMRPRFYPEDLKKAQCKSLAFAPEQAERMRRQVVQLMTRKQGTTP